MLLTILTIGFLVVYGLLIGFYYFHWKKLPEWQSTEGGSVFVSVIVAARNEEHTLPKLIEDLSVQTYPEDLFEVIVVAGSLQGSPETFRIPAKDRKAVVIRANTKPEYR